MPFVLEITGIGKLLGEKGYILKGVVPEVITLFLDCRLMSIQNTRLVDLENTAGPRLLDYEGHPHFPGIWRKFEIVDALWKLTCNLGNNKEIFLRLKQQVFNWDLETPILDREPPSTL